jgi:hypothetical protein
LYDLIIKFNFNDHLINDEVVDRVRRIKEKGNDYEWAIMEKGKSRYLFIKKRNSKMKQRRNMKVGHKRGNTVVITTKEKKEIIKTKTQMKKMTFMKNIIDMTKMIEKIEMKEMKDTIIITNKHTTLLKMIITIMKNSSMTTIIGEEIEEKVDTETIAVIEAVETEDITITDPEQGISEITPTMTVLIM